jgi:hypothetical protein
MERTVPSATSEEIRLYRATLYSLLRSSAEIKLRTLEEVHAGMKSLLHAKARQPGPDVSAFIYSLLRLPDCLPDVRAVVLGQSQEVFDAFGYAQVDTWQPVSARARRRRCFYDGHGVLACFIASRSDIEDIVPALTAFQMEWNKLHLLLADLPNDLPLAAVNEDLQAAERLAAILWMTPTELERLRVIWNGSLAENLGRIRAHKLNLSLRLLAGSLSAYQRATHTWWANLAAMAHADVANRPIYFISSNNHSLPNLLTGFALRREALLSEYVERDCPADLQEEWQSIRSRRVASSHENFLYYLLKKYQQSREGQGMLEEQLADEAAHGIQRLGSAHSFELEAQVVELAHLDPDHFDPRLHAGLKLDRLARSNALIVNIDYPLGLSAYNLLSKIGEQTARVLGVYIMGKAATLNAVRGDVMIPNVVQDEHSHNTYLFQNCFDAADLAPYLVYGTVLDHQKAVCVLGTFLQNSQIMDVFFREGYADIEMEAGPYLSAVYEMSRPKRHPVDEIVHLHELPFDLGILHYASDTPLTKGENLGAGTLSYYGMDSTYAAAVAILRRVLSREVDRLV